MKSLRAQYAQQKEKLSSRLKEFKSLSSEQQYKELLFCLLTPQSSAQRCWQAVEEISKLQKLEHNKVLEILSKKTRFHHTKAKRILQAPQTWKKISPLLKNPDKKELRNQIALEVSGFGLKESSHFLRNIGLSDNKIAILDRHILKNLAQLKIIDSPKIKNARNYLEIEQAFLDFASKVKIPPDELDLLWWSKENGEIFK